MAWRDWVAKGTAPGGAQRGTHTHARVRLCEGTPVRRKHTCAVCRVRCAGRGGHTHRGWLDRFFTRLDVKDVSVALGTRHCSSSRANMPSGFLLSIKSSTSWLSGNSMC
jgi:hypothetical protein